jgi:hypothetical protein
MEDLVTLVVLAHLVTLVVLEHLVRLAVLAHLILLAPTNIKMVHSIPTLTMTLITTISVHTRRGEDMQQVVVRNCPDAVCLHVALSYQWHHSLVIFFISCVILYLHDDHSIVFFLLLLAEDQNKQIRESICLKVICLIWSLCCCGCGL